MEEHQPWRQTIRHSLLNKSKRQTIVADKTSVPITETNLSTKSKAEVTSNKSLQEYPEGEPNQIFLKESSATDSKDFKNESEDDPREKSRSMESNGSLSSHTSLKLAKSNKIEDQINLQHLVELMRLFHEGDDNKCDGLDINEFKTVFEQILGKGKDDQQIAMMFMKIDANCEGTVDWDEFCTHMLLEYQEKEVMAGGRPLPFPYPLKIFNSQNHEVISKITFLPSLHRHTHPSGSGSATISSPPMSKHGEADSHVTGGSGVDGRYLSVSRDGTLSFWKSDFTLQRAITVESEQPKLTWVTDMVVLPNANKVLLSFTDVLALYDLATPNCDLCVTIVGLPHCILQMDYWFNPKQLNYAVLILGDAGGGVTVFEFTNATCFLFVSTTTPHQCHRISFSELIHYKRDSLRIKYRPKVHKEWVSKVKYVPFMSYVMSSSMDHNCSLNLADLHDRRDGAVFKVWKGVTSFVCCKEWNIIGTGGLDRSVRFWNPYVTKKPIAVLKGHTTAIMHVEINSSQGYMLSFSKDMELRVWSIQYQLCLQRCLWCQPLLPQHPTAFYLHPRTGDILVGSNKLAALESSASDDQLTSGMANRGVLSHDRQLCAALYNGNFNQVVSGCHGSVISVWDVDTGEKTMQFSHCHGTMEITAMSFDHTLRRLITGGRDGSIKIWNFNNGACLSVFKNKYQAEITSICFTKQRIVVGGWNRLITIYGDTKDPDDIIPKYSGAGAHKEDILCMAHQEPNILASASYDGDIRVWNLNLDRSIDRLNAREASKSRRGGLKQEYGSCTNRKDEGGQKQQENNLHSDTYTKDENAVEQIAFLNTRNQDLTSATLVACGAGGWVHLWNIYGGGLIGEYNIWDTPRHTIQAEDHSLHSVTALKVNSSDTIMLTGNSLGYIQTWDISEYCISVPNDQKPVCTPPTYTTVWRGHLSSIVSIDLAEGKGLLITASTDCSVKVWTTKGRYIGTFGEKCQWNLTYPIQLQTLPRKIPPGINRYISHNTLQTISGPYTSKWELAKNLFSLIRKAKLKEEAIKRFKMTNGSTDREQSDVRPENVNKSRILGKCYERKTRFREPITNTPLKHRDGRLVGIYHSLACSEIKEPEQCQPPSSLSGRVSNTSDIPFTGDDSEIVTPSLKDNTVHHATKQPHTEYTPHTRKVAISE